MKKNQGVRKKPSVRIDPGLRQEITILAIQKGLSKNFVLEEVVRAGLAFYKVQEKLITPTAS
jgi:hypothetical protein